VTENCAISHHPAPKDHDHKHDRGYGRVRVALGLAVSLIIIQGLGSWLSGSLALLADTVHVLSDALSLAVAWGAGILAVRPQSHKRSYGYYRLEVLAALVNGTALLIVAALILRESYARWSNPSPLLAGTMFWFALFGLVLNLWMLFTLHPAQSSNLNIKGAYLHVLGDALSSVVVLVSSIIIYFFNIYWLDPLAGGFVALMIAFMSIRLVYQSVHILLEGTPLHLNSTEVQTSLRSQFREIQNIHDFHIWQITSDLVALTAHIEASITSLDEQRQLTEEINAYLSSQYQIGHSTLQIEVAKK